MVLGDHDITKQEGPEQRFKVALVISHSQYKYWTFDNDIMLLKVRDVTQDFNADIDLMFPCWGLRLNCFQTLIIRWIKNHVSVTCITTLT